MSAETSRGPFAVDSLLGRPGESTIGENVIGWGRYDIFTVPRNAWASHKAVGGTARIFRVNDFEMLRRLDLFREETRQN